MSLTRDDLEAIGTLIDQKLDRSLEPIKNEQQVQGKTLVSHSQVLESIGESLETNGKTLKYLKNKVNRIAKTVDIIGRTYDENIVENSREIIRIKDHLGISSKH